MPNKNYERGRRAEYRLQHQLQALGQVVLRTAGSHGFADLVSVDPDTGVATFIQVKATKQNPKTIINAFMKAPPLTTAKVNHEIWVWHAGQWYMKTYACKT